MMSNEFELLFLCAVISTVAQQSFPQEQHMLLGFLYYSSDLLPNQSFKGFQTLAGTLLLSLLFCPIVLHRNAKNRAPRILHIKQF